MRLWVLGLLLVSAPLSAQRPGDWPHYGGDPGGQKYSALEHINKENVAPVEVAWVWETGEEPVPGPRLESLVVKREADV